MAVPRDFDAKISSIENVFLYGVDDLKTIIAKKKPSELKQVRVVRVLLKPRHIILCVVLFSGG